MRRRVPNSARVEASSMASISTRSSGVNSSHGLANQRRRLGTSTMTCGQPGTSRQVPALGPPAPADAARTRGGFFVYGSVSTGAAQAGPSNPESEMNRIEVGVLGATGVVGQQFVARLARHPWFDLTWLAASERVGVRSTAR